MTYVWGNMVRTNAVLTLPRRDLPSLPGGGGDFWRRAPRRANADTARVRLLGPMDIVVDGVVREVPGARRKAVLAVLALRAGGIVSTDLLTEVVWDGRPPSTAANTLQSHVSYLRGVLGSRDAIVAVPPGYRLQIGAEPTDARQAEEIIARSRQARDPAETAARLRKALTLWRGHALTDLSGVMWFDEQASRLELIRTGAVKALSQARLAMGEHAELVPELRELAVQHPFDEEVHAQLMLALYRAGRQADSLQVYQNLHRCLDEMLGIEPGPPLRDLQLAILRHHPAIAAPIPATGTVSGGPPGVAPASLPPVSVALAGRQTELEVLNEGLLHDRAATAILALSGPAGVGKTTLAVHWAHRVADRFPDGQLYLSLRGCDPAGAVRRALETLGVAAHDLPAGFDARVGLYRTLLAGRRVLVVLDDARDAQQVRPLLPHAPGSAVLVTGRRQLTALLVTDGARSMTLDPLLEPEALDLLAGRLGRRVSAEPAAAQAIARHCGGLPLALAIVCAYASANPMLSLDRLAHEMSTGPGALRILSGEDHRTDFRQAIAPSYESLSGRAAALFRCLAAHPVGVITAQTAAAVAGSTVDEAGQALAELLGIHLVRQRSYGEYELLPLTRAFAASVDG